jgi:hypothetical protein
MKKQIKHFSILQTSKVLAILYGVIAILFVPFLLIPALGNDNGGSMVLISIAAPFLYAILGFIFTALFCWIYNIVAKYVGGIEFTLEDLN